MESFTTPTQTEFKREFLDRTENKNLANKMMKQNAPTKATNSAEKNIEIAQIKKKQKKKKSKVTNNKSKELKRI